MTKKQKISCQRVAISKNIVYVLLGFPVLSETFILQEILEMERQGLHVHIYSLMDPLKNKRNGSLWNGRSEVTYISRLPKHTLINNIIKCIFKFPLRFMHVLVIALLIMDRPKTVISCLICATFLAIEFERENVTHIHAHFAAEPTTVALFTHVLTKIPYSFTAHAYDIFLSSRKALAYKVRMANFVVAISMYNQRYLTRLVDENISQRIYCIYNGLNLKDLPFKFPCPSLPKIQPIILSVSRLVEKKGLFYLLHACHILVQQGYTFICYIIGDGPLRHALEQKISELELSNVVILIGEQTHSQVIEMYQKATLTVLPCIVSKNGDRDGLPTVLIESLYMGLPTVSTTVSGIPELITSEVNGLLVPPNDSIALAKALSRLIDDPSLGCRLSKAGHEIVLRSFDISCNVKSLIHLFFPNLSD